MGRKDKRYSKSLTEQIYARLVAMLKAGEGRSKKADAKTGDTDGKIYSYNTYHTYIKHCGYFAEWLKSHYPKVTTLKKARKYVCEYLQHRVEQGLSAYTISTEAAALNKLFGIQQSDPDYFKVPKRSRAKIKRSRSEAERDKGFSKTNNAELIAFCRGTGLRRSELAKLQGKDYISKEQILFWVKKLCSEGHESPYNKKRLALLQETVELYPDCSHFVYVKGKGGRERISPIIGDHADEIANRIKATPKDQKVWQYIHSHADIHSYRSDYATTLYKQYARAIDSIPYDMVNEGSGRRYKSEVYTCRNDERGKQLDKRAMLLASKALGHNRIEVIARHYLRGI
jgi:integrase